MIFWLLGIRFQSFVRFDDGMVRVTGNGRGGSKDLVYSLESFAVSLKFNCENF